MSAAWWADEQEKEEMETMQDRQCLAACEEARRKELAGLAAGVPLFFQEIWERKHLQYLESTYAPSELACMRLEREERHARDHLLWAERFWYNDLAISMKEVPGVAGDRLFTDLSDDDGGRVRTPA